MCGTRETSSNPAESVCSDESGDCRGTANSNNYSIRSHVRHCSSTCRHANPTFLNLRDTRLAGTPSRNRASMTSGRVDRGRRLSASSTSPPLMGLCSAVPVRLARGPRRPGGEGPCARALTVASFSAAPLTGAALGMGPERLAPARLPLPTGSRGGCGDPLEAREPDTITATAALLDGLAAGTVLSLEHDPALTSGSSQARRGTIAAEGAAASIPYPDRLVAGAPACVSRFRQPHWRRFRWLNILTSSSRHGCTRRHGPPGRRGTRSRIAYHDPCGLVCVFEPPRQVIEALTVK